MMEGFDMFIEMRNALSWPRNGMMRERFPRLAVP